MERLALSLIALRPENSQPQYSRNLDSVFTGFTEATLEEQKINLAAGNQVDLENLETYREMPSIVSLKSKFGTDNYSCF